MMERIGCEALLPRARRGVCLRAAALALAVVAAGPAAGQQDFDAVEIQTIDLGSGLYMMTGAGGNLGLSVGEDGAFLIDDQYAPLTAKIEAAVAAVGAKPLRFVLNTHWHGDHTGGNENLGGKGVLILAHDAVRTRMSSEQFIAAFDRRVPPAPRQALPVVTFAESVTLHLNGHRIHAFHVPPAHTDGDSIVHFETANVVHMGDTFFNRMYPFFDASSGGRIDGMLAVAERVLAMTDAGTKIIPGHGPLADRADLEASHAMLVAVRGRVAAALEAGRSLDEVLASKPTADFDARFAGGFLEPEQFVRLVYGSLAAER